MTPSADLIGAGVGGTGWRVEEYEAAPFKGRGAVTDDYVRVMRELWPSDEHGYDGQIYSPVFDSLSGCTIFNEWEYALEPGSSVVGCVAFQVPTGVMVTKVNFLSSTTRAEWDVP